MFSWLNSLVSGEEQKAVHGHDQEIKGNTVVGESEEGRPHGNETAHEHGPADAQAKDTAQEHSHTHGGEACHQDEHKHDEVAEIGHGHSHGGEACHGHGHSDEHQEDEAPRVPKTDMLTREQFFRIFSQFQAMAMSEQGKERLRKAVQNGEQVEDELAKMEIDICKELGIDGDHAQACFRLVFEYYQTEDPALCAAFERFLQLQSMACDEAELGPEKFQEKLILMRFEKMKDMGMAGATKEEQDETLEKMKIQMQKLMQLPPEQRAVVQANLMRQMLGSGGEDPQSAMKAQLQAAAQAMIQSGVPQEEVMRQMAQKMASMQVSLGEHGHSHDGKPCHGHGTPTAEQIEQMMKARMQMQDGGAHGHSHDGKPCHGHGQSDLSPQKMQQLHQMRMQQMQQMQKNAAR